MSSVESMSHDGRLFRVFERQVDHKPYPYEFVHRIGAVTVFPVAFFDDEPHVLSIHNERTGYTASTGLPSGNLVGGFDAPEDPADAALRELAEETGYGVNEGLTVHNDTFMLRPLSNTINYPRFFSVVRPVECIGVQDDDPHEVVTLRPKKTRALC